MKNVLIQPFAIVMLGMSALLISASVSAQTPLVSEKTAFQMVKTDVKSGKFVKKRYSINGNWFVKKENGQTLISFDESFKTKGGPDLKLYLSPKTVETLSSDTVEHDSIKLGVLKSNRGSQTYIIPDDIDLSQYKSLIIHCEAFSVLWGGFDLTE